MYLHVVHVHTCHITQTSNKMKYFINLKTLKKILLSKSGTQPILLPQPPEGARSTGVYHQAQLYFHAFVLLMAFKEIFLFKKRQQIGSAQISRNLKAGEFSQQLP